jgi:hypothetical protein
MLSLLAICAAPPSEREAIDLLFRVNDLLKAKRRALQSQEAGNEG